MVDLYGSTLHSGDWVKKYGTEVIFEVDCISAGVTYLKRVRFNNDGSYSLVEEIEANGAEIYRYVKIPSREN